MQHLSKLILGLLIVVTLGCEAEQGNTQTPPASTPASTASESQPAPKSPPLPTPVATNFVAGTHYEVLPQPVPTSDPSRIEVTEVFWYGCGHCFDFEPILEQWAETIPEDVVLVRNPAMWDQQGIMERHARIYYAARALGVLDKMHKATFEAMNLHKNPLETEKDIAKLFEENGISNEEFTQAFHSFGVNSAVRQAEARQRGYRTQGTPEIVVDGTYRVSGRMTGSHQGMLDVTDFLINKIRSEK